jgi:hypothetical protein
MIAVVGWDSTPAEFLPDIGPGSLSQERTRMKTWL